MKGRARFAAMLVGCVGFAATLPAAGGGFEPVGSDRAAVLEDQRVVLFSLNEIIEPAASDPLLAPVVTRVESVLTVVEAVIAAASEEGDPAAEVTFHDESGLLILRGEEAEIIAVREALELIRLDIRRVREEMANQDRALRTRIVDVTPEVDEAQRAELEAGLRIAMIGIERAHLEMEARQEELDEANTLAEGGAIGRGELRELRSALEHARLAMHEAEVQAEARRRQLEAMSQGPEAMGRMRMAEAEGELRMALIAVERAQVELMSREDSLDEAKVLAERDFMGAGELRERRVAMEHARLGVEQAAVMVDQMRARLEAAQQEGAEGNPGAAADGSVGEVRRKMEELGGRRAALQRRLTELRARAQDDGQDHAEKLDHGIATTENEIALLEIAMVQVRRAAVEDSQRRADAITVRAELTRRNEQLARVEAAFGEARDREAAASREMIEHVTRLEVRLEETQRVLEHKHVECAELAERLREMMVRVEVEAVRRHSLEAEIQRLREALELAQGKE